MSLNRPRTSILDKPISRGKGEVALSTFALLFSEMIQYSQSKVMTVPELQTRWVHTAIDVLRVQNKLHLIDTISSLHDLGKDVGTRVIDLYFMRERNSKRETKLINMLLFIKTTLWKVKHVCIELNWIKINETNFDSLSLEKKLISSNMPMTTNELITSLKLSRWSTNSSACRRTKVHWIVQHSQLDSLKLS